MKKLLFITLTLHYGVYRCCHQRVDKSQKGLVIYKGRVYVNK